MTAINMMSFFIWKDLLFTFGQRNNLFLQKNINIYLIYLRIEFKTLYIDHISKNCVVLAKGPKKEKLLEEK